MSSVLDRFLGTSEPEDQPPRAGLSVTLDELFDALKYERRRFVISQLAHLPADESISRYELSLGLAYYENDFDSLNDVTTAARKRADVALYQSHLPPLDGLGLIEFDRSRLGGRHNTDVVRPTPGTDAAWRVIRAAEQELGGDPA